MIKKNSVQLVLYLRLEVFTQSAKCKSDEYSVLKKLKSSQSKKNSDENIFVFVWKVLKGSKAKSQNCKERCKGSTSRLKDYCWVNKN